MRIVFMGTPDFAVPCLQALLDAGEEVVGVFTQPDKPKGRGYTQTPPPVKVLAQTNQIPVFQPKSMRDGEALSILTNLQPDLIVVVAYGKILPKEILFLPKFRCINIHASLLPKYRGAAPIQWCVLNGEETTGVTSMLMDEGLDTGDMLLRKEIRILPDMTAGELHDRLTVLGAQVLLETLEALRADALRPLAQTEESCYAPMLEKSLCPLDFSADAQTVHNRVRGLNPWPVATAEIGGKRMKIYKTALGTCKTELPPGHIVSLGNGIEVACGNGETVCILELQPEGKRRMPASAYLVGHKLSVGEALQ